jgi:hypothetical protein
MNLSPLKELLDKGRSKVEGNEAIVEVGNSKTEIGKWESTDKIKCNGFRNGEKSGDWLP